MTSEGFFYNLALPLRTDCNSFEISFYFVKLGINKTFSTLCDFLIYFSFFCLFLKSILCGYESLISKLVGNEIDLHHECEMVGYNKLSLWSLKNHFRG